MNWGVQIAAHNRPAATLSSPQRHRVTKREEASSVTSHRWSFPQRPAAELLLGGRGPRGQGELFNTPPSALRRNSSSSCAQRQLPTASHCTRHTRRVHPAARPAARGPSPTRKPVTSSSLPWGQHNRPLPGALRASTQPNRTLGRGPSSWLSLRLK